VQRGGDGVPGRAAQTASVARIGLRQRRGDQSHVQCRRAKDGPHRTAERDFLDVGGRLAAIALFILIADGDREHRCRRVEGRLEQRGVEMSDRAAVGGGAFGEDGKAFAAAQGLHQMNIEACRIARLAAFEEQRLRPRTEPADERPAPHFRFGDEAHRHDGIQHEYVQPGDVIGDEEPVAQAVQGIVVGEQHADIKNGQQPGRPVLQDAAAEIGIQPGIDRRQNQAPGNVQSGARRSEQGDSTSEHG